MVEELVTFIDEANKKTWAGNGAEQIFFQGTEVFEQVVMGGIVINKDDQRQPIYPWDFAFEEI
jgi:hypothetical protein